MSKEKTSEFTETHYRNIIEQYIEEYKPASLGDTVKVTYRKGQVFRGVVTYLRINEYQDVEIEIVNDANESAFYVAGLGDVIETVKPRAHDEI